MNLYGEIILEHFKTPQNYGLLSNASLVEEARNPLCGDKVTVSLKISAKNILEEIGFEGDGCAISIATLSVLSEEIKGKSLEQINSLTFQDINEMLGIEISPARSKCALLGLDCIKKMIQNFHAK